jgi:hypothetical protein
MTDKEKIIFKTALKERAIAILHERVEHALAAMDEAQLAANSVEKSTVGDKHETSRSMALLDREIHARQLESAQKELSFVQHIEVTLFNPVVAAGSYVETDNGNYFFLAGLGSIDTQHGKIFFLSVNSPIGKIFTSRKAGDKVDFNGKSILIRNVF